MIAILCGLGAALFVAGGTLAGTAATKQIGSVACTAWMMFVGFVVVLPAVVVEGGPLPDLEAVCLMLVVGALALVGLLIYYSALGVGPVSVVAPIISAEGAVAAVIACFAGEVPGPLKLLGMLVVLGAVITLVALSADPDEGCRTSTGRAAALAVVACFVLGAMLFAQGRLGEQVSLAWSVFPARAVSVVFLTLPLAFRRDLAISRANFKLVAVAAVADIGAITLFVLGSRHDVAVTSVLLSQYAVFAVILATWLLGERLRISQRWAVVALVSGVALVALSSG